MADDMSPAVEDLLEGFDTSVPAPLGGRELRVELIASLVFLATTVPMAALLPHQQGLSVGLALALVAAYAVMWRIRFAIGYGWTVPTELVFVPMLFLLPLPLVPLLVVAGASLGNLPDLLSRKMHPSRWIVAIGDSWHAVGPTLVLIAAGSHGPEWAQWPIYVLALVGQFAFDFCASTAREWLWVRVSPNLQLPILAWTFMVDLLLAPIGLLAAFVATQYPYAVLLTLPLAGLLAIFARERQTRIDSALELSRAYRGTTLLLSDVLEAEDEYTGIHSRDVVSLAVAIADEMGLDSARRRNVEFGALLHDVGKIAVPSEIINKPGPLTDDEWVIIKAHTVEGQRMLDRVGGVLSEVGRVVRSSHERWDGGGYPDGLVGEEIPLESSIVSCSDAFNAMTTDRSYRRGRSPAVALEELRQHSGTQFRPDVVEVLSAIVRRDLGVHGTRAADDETPAEPVTVG